MIRPELRKFLSRWSEPLVAGGISLAGLWLAFRGGWFLALLGGMIILVGAALLIGAWQRMPFRRRIAAPGVVEIDEGTVRYYDVTVPGGEIALRDLTEIRLLRLNGRGYWRLRSDLNEALLVPVDAAGAEALAHAFTALPGLDMGLLSAALAHLGEQRDAMRTVWTRPGRGGLTRPGPVATCDTDQS
ncbi:hypothetical protein Q0601_21755 [Paracoccus onubensis]|uniref:hypothetical protein n=1 Tax=Paracoccus onubensis TaxID=1675788 RepID=UPI00273213CD|nr:hypothetical protein [Paracoccus onubensis]MDP0929820.1 hypothetical protein [Paracoccus onubensis]